MRRLRQNASLAAVGLEVVELIELKLRESMSQRLASGSFFFRVSAKSDD
jgi:hypothetical protein